MSGEQRVKVIIAALVCLTVIACGLMMTFGPQPAVAP